MDFLRPTHLKVHLDRLQNNFRFLQSLLGAGQFICPMIKANAYGHGDLAVAKALESQSTPFVGVASVEEGVGLREGHVGCPILTFGFYSLAAAKEAVAQNLTPVVSNFEQLNWLKNLGVAIKIHLKFDSGMHRLGFQLDQVEDLLETLKSCSHLTVEGICTHLSSGANMAVVGESSSTQVKVFNTIERFFPQVKYRHVYNSAAITSLKKQGKNFLYGARPGLSLYGIDADIDFSLKPLVAPVMELKSKVVAIQKVRAGEIVSYGGTWQAPIDSLIGIVPAGYADGISRSLSNCGEVLLLGRRTPIRGRVCMDYTMIDLTQFNQESSRLVGADVVFIGQQNEELISVEEVSQKSGRITYEVMTGIGPRVPRFYGA